MYLNGPEVDKYMNYNEKLDCRSMWNYTLPLVTSNLTALILNATARTALIVTERHPKFECYYSAVKRPVVETGQDVSGFNENSVKYDPNADRFSILFYGIVRNSYKS
jgi:hypothetical protein